MSSLILDNIALTILLPLWIFLIIMCGRFFSVYVNKTVIYLLTLLSSFLGACVCSFALFNLTETTIKIYPFIKINEFSIPCGIQVDKLSLIIALLLFVISFAVQLFSVSYMKNEKKVYKFFAFLNLFNFAMSALLFSPNLFQFYVFWELVSAVSYLLIGFEYKDEKKSLASRRVFIMNRVGDTALMSGIVLVSYFMYSYAENYSFSALMFEDFNSISTMLLAYASTPAFCVICGLFILAAVVKSAQFPFYSWLQDAMEAKLPVSALLHSATMVAAGVYLIIKMMPFFTLKPVMTTVILLIGLVTAVICSILASIETQPKKVLAYSTSANLGLMFMALGFVNIKMAVIFLVVHGFIKSLLFVLLPAEKNMPKINFILFVISALTLSGLILSGVGIKELLYKNILYTDFLPYIYMFVCFVSAFYIIRLAALIYKNGELTEEKNLTEITAFFILLSGNILLYIFLRSSYHIAEPYAAGVGGAAFALLLFKHNVLENFNKTPKIAENVSNVFVPAIYMKISQGFAFIDNKIFSNYKPILFISKLPVRIADFIEVKIMNKSVDLIRDITKGFSKFDKYMQTGNIQRYNAYAFIFVSIVIALVITGYTLLLS